MDEIPARLTISEAIKYSMVSRATFYRKFIDTGQLSYKTDNDGKKYVEFAELLRVCPNAGTAPIETTENVSTDTVRYSESLGKIDLLELEVKFLREQLADTREQLHKSEAREADLKNMLAQVQPKKQIGWFGRLLGKG